MSAAAIMAMQEAQHQKQMWEQALMSAQQSKMTHETSLVTEASKGSDKRFELTMDMASHKHGAANNSADKVAQNLA